MFGNGSECEGDTRPVTARVFDDWFFVKVATEYVRRVPGGHVRAAASEDGEPVRRLRGDMGRRVGAKTSECSFAKLTSFSDDWGLFLQRVETVNEEKRASAGRGREEYGAGTGEEKSEGSAQHL